MPETRGLSLRLHGRQSISQQRHSVGTQVNVVTRQARAQRRGDGCCSCCVVWCIGTNAERRSFTIQ